MAKKFLAVFLSFVLLFGIVSLTYAKKKETNKKEEVQETKPVTTVSKVVETKDPLKEKTSVAVDGSSASLRIWSSNKMAIDFSAGLGFQSEPSTFAFNLGGGLVFPMMESERLNAYVVPGLNIGFTKITINTGFGTVSQNIFTLLAGAGFEFEGFIVPQILSIGSSVGVFIGIQSSEGTTSFIFDAARGIGLKPLIIRFYF
ncbi:MAG: hypothetical protein N3E50_02045 [Candidatus Goldbacteria bacterium]|nr:hypothetical protein [Candidatus Goldiibacteriota bacterium]